MLVTYFRKSRK